MASIKKPTRIRVFIPAAIIVLISVTLLYSFCKRSEKDEVIMQMVTQLIEMQHFSPSPLDDTFSEKAFDAYLKRLDPAKQFLTKEDIGQMSKHKLQIDDQIRNNTFQLYNLAVNLFGKRLVEAQEYYKEILSQPFNFDEKETYELDYEKMDWAANSTELKDRWRKDLKYRTLIRLSDMMKQQEKETDESKHKSNETMESDARQKILKSYDDQFQYRNQQKDEDRFAIYINAITAVFDPHTQYQTPADKASFDIRMSGQFEGIGAQLTPSEGYAKVVMLVPGSPAWRQGDLKVNDLITKVKQENEQEPVDIFGMRLDDAVKLIRGKKGTKVTLTIKRGDGSTHEITITRDVVVDEETYAKSAILADPKSKNKIGYIYLPSFYVDFKNTTTGRASSDDVAKEIEKLKKEKVQGIILDLRSNTGGSLPDAIKMAGLFIESGPIVQVKSNIGSPRVYSDTDPKVQYNGPLLVLVNSISASASEIVSAAMQDYQRAIIMGGPSTFGKGTVQVVADLNDYLPINMSKLKPLGTLMLTIQKYYRINGGATQLKGVTPDIILPDVFSGLEIGERYEDYALPWTTVEAARYKIWEKPVAVAKLREKSQARTSNNENFKLLTEQIEYYQAQRKETQTTLNLVEFRNEEKARNEVSKRIEEASKKKTELSISALIADQEVMKGDTAKIARSEKWISDLNKDIFLEEAVKVIGDMK